MEIVIATDEEVKPQILRTVFLHREKESVRPLGDIPDRISSNVERILKRVRFRGDMFEHLLSVGAKESLLLVSLGEDIDNYALFRGASAAVRAARGHLEIAVYLPGKDLEQAARTVTEGLIFGGYEFSKHRSDGGRPEKAYIILPAPKHRERVQKGAHTGTVIARNINLARDLANDAGGDMTPEGFASQVLSMSRGKMMKVRVIEADQLRQMGMNGILSVGSGSSHEPRLLVMEIDREAKPRGRKKKPLILIGKGVVFDSGGISLKSAKDMWMMRYDKSGACAVVGAMFALEELEVKHRVIAIIPLAENIPGRDSYKPGDFVRMYSGKVVEIISTDAEGRLLLADSLTYGARMKPYVLIDIATLTGACLVALGRHACGVLGNEQRVLNRVLRAAASAGERLWQFPLWKEYFKDIRGTFSHLKNVGGRYGGAITAAAFLNEFVEETPWVHMDIAGVAWREENAPDAAAGATGFGVRTLVQFMLDWVPP